VTIPADPRVRGPKRQPARRGALAVLAGLSCVAVVCVLVTSDPNLVPRVFGRVSIVLSGGTLIDDSTIVFQKGVADCGPAALANLARVLGVEAPSIDSLARLAGTEVTGTRASGLIAAASALGIHLYPNKTQPDELSHLKTPFIAWIKQSHFVTVEGRSHPKLLTVSDPIIGRYKLTEETFLSSWTGEALLLVQ